MKHRITSLPLAVRLAFVATFVLGMSLLVGGLAFRDTLMREQRGEIDEAARERISTLTQTIASGTIPVRLPSERDSPLFAQIVSPDGHVVASTTNVDDMLAMVNLTVWKPTPTILIGSASVDKANCRVFVRGVDTPQGRYGVIVAAPLRATTQAVRALTNQMVAISPLVMLLSAGLFWLLARRALKPVDTLRTEVDAISGSAVHQRVSAPVADDEVGRLARTMNALLGRVEDANVRQTQFVSDASHELRSPLAGIRTRMEVGLRSPETTDWPSVARGVLSDSSRMERLTTDLLYLARGEVTPPLTRANVDLDDLVLEEAATLRMRTNIVISTSEVSGGRVRGDADQLRRVVINLLDNAVRYATSSVSCAIRSEGGDVVFEVRDDGHGIPTDQRTRIFERFTRIEEDRSRPRGGSGLGLAIVADILRAHSASVEVLDAPPHGTLMRVSFPQPD
jgi:signal transduction histidine kinase